MRSSRLLPAVAILVLGLLALSAGAAGPAVPGFGPAIARAASPTASPAAGDLRSSGEGAGAAGNPGFALVAGLGVIGAGVLIALGTSLYVRLTTRADGP